MAESADPPRAVRIRQPGRESQHGAASVHERRPAAALPRQRVIFRIEPHAGMLGPELRADESDVRIQRLNAHLGRQKRDHRNAERRGTGNNPQSIRINPAPRERRRRKIRPEPLHHARVRQIAESERRIDARRRRIDRPEPDRLAARAVEVVERRAADLMREAASAEFRRSRDLAKSGPTNCPATRQVAGRRKHAVHKAEIHGILVKRRLCAIELRLQLVQQFLAEASGPQLLRPCDARAIVWGSFRQYDFPDFKSVQLTLPLFPSASSMVWIP